MFAYVYFLSFWDLLNILYMEVNEYSNWCSLTFNSQTESFSCFWFGFLNTMMHFWIILRRNEDQGWHVHWRQIWTFDSKSWSVSGGKSRCICSNVICVVVIADSSKKWLVKRNQDMDVVSVRSCAMKINNAAVAVLTDKIGATVSGTKMSV